MGRHFDAVALLVGRCLIAVLFAAGAVQKLVDPAPAQAMVTGIGLPAVVIWPVAVMNAGAAVALVLGVAVRPVAVLLAVYCSFTSLFHWIPDDPWQMSIFVKNWAIAGGCLALMVAGSGRLALKPD